MPMLQPQTYPWLRRQIRLSMVEEHHHQILPRGSGRPKPSAHAVAGERNIGPPDGEIPRHRCPLVQTTDPGCCSLSLTVAPAVEHVTTADAYPMDTRAYRGERPVVPGHTSCCT